MVLKIYFCDGCNESIPLKDINENRITIDAGKIFCARCAPKKPARDGAWSSPVLVGALVLLLGLGIGLIAYLTAQQIHEVNADLRRLDRDTGHLPADIAALRSATMPRDEAERLRASIQDDLQGVKRDLSIQVERVRVLEGTIRTEVEASEKRMGDTMRAELVALAKQVEKLGEDARTQAAAFEMLKASLAAIASSIEQLRSDLESARAARGSGEGGPESGPDDSLPDDASRDLLATLKDADPMRRFSAVMELARFRNPAVLTALEAMLQDPESYVRDGAVRTLRKINAPSSIPAIIKALRDDDFFVRSSAREALKSMTSADIPFDPGADLESRERVVRDWESWWAASKDRLLRK